MCLFFHIVIKNLTCQYRYTKMNLILSGLMLKFVRREKNVYGGTAVSYVFGMKTFYLICSDHWSEQIKKNNLMFIGPCIIVIIE